MIFDTFEGSIDNFIHRHQIIVPVHVDDKYNHIYDLSLSSFLVNTVGYKEAYEEYEFKINHCRDDDSYNMGKYISHIYEVRDYHYGPYFRLIGFMPIDVNSITLGNNFYTCLDKLRGSEELPIGLIKFECKGHTWDEVLAYCYNNFEHKISRIITYDPVYSELKNIVNEKKEEKRVKSDYVFDSNGKDIDYDILD